MATGGIALLLSEQPHTFHGLMTIGKVVYIFDLVIFLLLVTLISIRFIRSPEKLRLSLTHPTEGLFFPTAALCIPTITGCMIRYGLPTVGSWIIMVTEVIFWVYAAVTFVIAVLQYWFWFMGTQMTVQSMIPSWLLPIFPVMLTGTIASVTGSYVDESRRLAMLVAGATFQGLGFWVAIIIYASFIARLMDAGLPKAAMRPGMFIAVGPPSFTGLALLGMARALLPGHSFFISHPSAIDSLQAAALVFAIFIWSLAFWFFCISALSCLASVPRMGFHLVWYAFVFPNVGFTIAVLNIGTELQSEGVLWVSSGMSISLVAMWLFVMVMQVRAIIRKEIWWPGQDEDKDEEEDEEAHKD